MRGGGGDTRSRGPALKIKKKLRQNSHALFPGRGGCGERAHAQLEGQPVRRLLLKRQRIELVIAVLPEPPAAGYASRLEAPHAPAQPHAAHDHGKGQEEKEYDEKDGGGLPGGDAFLAAVVPAPRWSGFWC